MSNRRKHEDASEYFYGDYRNYKKQAIQAAKDLEYDQEVIIKLKKAKSDAEIERIMVTARKGGKWIDSATSSLKNTLKNCKYTSTANHGEGRY